MTTTINELTLTQHNYSPETARTVIEGSRIRYIRVWLSLWKHSSCSRSARWNQRHVTNERFQERMWQLFPYSYSSCSPSCSAYLHSFPNYHTLTRSLRSANTNLLFVPRVRTTFASRGYSFSVAAPAVWNSLPSGIRDSFPLPIPSVVFLKFTVSSRLSAPHSGSPKCLRFGLWLTLYTLKIDLLTYLLQPLLNLRRSHNGLVLLSAGP